MEKKLDLRLTFGDAGMPARLSIVRSDNDGLGPRFGLGAGMFSSEPTVSVMLRLEDDLKVL